MEPSARSPRHYQHLLPFRDLTLPARDPEAGPALPAISREEIIAIPKRSKVELDRSRLGLSDEALREHYLRSGMNAAAMFESHEYQRDARALVERCLGSERIFLRAELTPERLAQARVLIAVGGDNHLQFVAARATTQIIIGINSDPVRSEGALTRFTAEQLPALIEGLEQGRYRVEEWRRLSASVNGITLPPAAGEIFIGEANRTSMSRYLIETRGGREEQKSSGLIVSTGAGSGGWYDAAIRYALPEGDIFPPTSARARFVTSEPFRGSLSRSRILYGTLAEGEQIAITSMNDDHGIVAVDSITQLPFPPGARAIVQLAPEKLRIMI